MRAVVDTVHLPYNYPLRVKQGADRVLELTFEDANGDPMDLTGYTSVLEVRDRPGGTSLLKLTELDGIVISALLGKVTMQLTHERSAALTFSQGEYDWYIASPATPPSYTYLLTGTFTVDPRIAE